MARPKKKVYTLQEKIALLKQAGLSPRQEDQAALDESKTDIPFRPNEALSERVKKLLDIIQSEPLKATDMLSLIMYDIEDNKVRTLIAKYLIEKGAVRIQKSVYMLRAESKLYREIIETLKEIQSCYENADSIIAVPIPSNTPGSMQIIGKDVQIDTLVNKPNVLFF